MNIRFNKFSFFVLIIVLTQGVDSLAEDLTYTTEGRDPSWSSILEEKRIPGGKNSNTGITGSIVDFNNKVVEKGPNASRPIEKAIRNHTLDNSVIEREDFHKCEGA